MTITVGMRVHVRQGAWRGHVGIVRSLERDEATLDLDGGSAHTKVDYLEPRTKCGICSHDRGVELRPSGSTVCDYCWDAELKALP